MEDRAMLVNERRSSKRQRCSPVAVVVSLVLLAAAVAMTAVLVLLFVPHGGRVRLCSYSADVLVVVGGSTIPRMLRQRLYSASSTLWAVLLLVEDSDDRSGGGSGSGSGSEEIFAGQNGTLQISDGRTTTVVDIFFGRKVCQKVTQPTTSSVCIDTTSSAWVSGNDVECPEESGAAPGTICTTWKRTALTTLGTQVETYFFEKETHHPRQYSVALGSSEPSRRNYLSFTAGAPPGDVFRAPSDVACSDFTDSSGFVEASGGDDESKLVNDPALVAAAKTAAKERGWTAGANTAFDGISTAEFAETIMPHALRSLNLLAGPSSFAASPSSHSSNLRSSKASLPTFFDASEQWPFCTSIKNAWNQGTCGCCYAMGAASALSDRFCIASNGTLAPLLSPQFILSCFREDLGCNGGYIEPTWRALSKMGTVTQDCVRFRASEVACPAACDNGDALEFFRTLEPYYVWSANTTEETIMTEIMEHGSVEVTFWAYKDLLYYQSGVYTRTPGSTLLGGHAVRIIGWGEEAGTKWWLVVNSWGTSWGDSGKFKIRRGTNELGIEDHVIAALPRI